MEITTTTTTMYTTTTTTSMYTTTTTTTTNSPPTKINKSVKILKYEEVRGREGPFTKYYVEVTDHPFQWIITKRFRNFVDLYQKMSSIYNSLPEFPPRLFKIFIDDRFLKERKKGLDDFFKQLSPQIYEECEELKIFLGFYSNRKIKPIPDNVSLRLTQDLWELTQVVAIEMESMTLSDGHTIVLPDLFGSVRSCLVELDRIKFTLDGVYGTKTRVDFLTQTADSRQDLTNVLEYLKEILQCRIKDLIAQEHYATEIFLSTIAQIDVALEWNEVLPSKVFKEVDAQTTVWDRIKQYQFESESKLTLLYQVPPQERENLKKELKKTQQKMKTELKAHNDPEIQETLSYLLQYIEMGCSDAFHLNNCATKLNKEKQTIFETRVYVLLEKINNHLTPESPKEAYLEVKQELTTLGKDIAAHRNGLQRRIDQKDINSEEYKASIAHLEDLQQNLADISFFFQEKFDSFEKIEERSTFDEATEVILNHIIINNNHNNNKIEEQSLFEL